VKEFPANFKNWIATIVAHDKGFGQTPGSLSDMVSHFKSSS
jgi:hypothetical protein